MKPILTAIALVFAATLQAQTPALDLSVRVEATTFDNPPQIDLKWRVSGSATAYTVYRKSPLLSSWGSPFQSLTATDSTFSDTNVVVGEVYEYRIVKSGSPSGNGYITASIERPEIGARGRLLLLTDSTNNGDAGFQVAVNQTLQDFADDGWDAEMKVVGESWPVTRVKDSISVWYQQDAVNSKALYLLGRVPVPYSGDINPDGHPDHKGAWPTDLYYGDISGTGWTDANINNATATDPRNQNIPGDGKFDPSMIPSDVELMVGRVDFRNLPLFSATETELLTRYLIKASNYKHGAFKASDKALVDDNFTGYAEGFAASGFRSFSPTVGIDSVNNAADFFAGSTANSGNSYLWGYGCGAGSYTSCSGVGTSTNFASDSLQMVFSMLFGSYFGDWDNNSALLRSALAQGWTLSTAWAGRPHWVFHPMALGEPVGHAARLTQNNNSVYHTSTLATFGRWIHNNLLGDPTLRIHYIAPPTLLSITDSAGSKLDWTASTDPVAGYNVYRRHADSTAFLKLNSAPVSALTFLDTLIIRPSRYEYVVKAVELDTTASGSYFNESLGIRGELELLVNRNEPFSPVFIAYPVPASTELHVFAPGRNVSLKLYDMQGRLLKSMEMNHEGTLHIDELPSGIYMLEGMFEGGEKKVLRIVKQ